MSTSTKVILDLIATDYSLYSAKHREKQPTKEAQEELRDRLLPNMKDKELAGLIAKGYMIKSLKKTCHEIKAHQVKLTEAGITKSKRKTSPTEVILTYKIKSTQESSQIFNAPWRRELTEPNSQVKSISASENHETIELNLNLNFSVQ